MPWISKTKWNSMKADVSRLEHRIDSISASLSHFQKGETFPDPEGRTQSLWMSTGQYSYGGISAIEQKRPLMVNVTFRDVALDFMKRHKYVIGSSGWQEK